MDQLFRFADTEFFEQLCRVYEPQCRGVVVSLIFFAFQVEHILASSAHTLWSCICRQQGDGLEVVGLVHLRQDCLCQYGVFLVFPVFP